MIHKMKLNNEPYNQILNGKKSIELRLYDAKRKMVAINDTIIFINIETKKQIAVKVLDLCIGKSFEELFGIIDKEAAGFSPDDNIKNMTDVMHRIYPATREDSYGVVGIKISKPRVELEFPIEPDKIGTDHITVLPVIGNRLIISRNENGQFCVPDGFFNKWYTEDEEAQSILKTKTGAEECQMIYPVTAYRIIDIEGKNAEIKGKLYIAEVKQNEWNATKCRSIEIAPEKMRGDNFPDFPNDIAGMELCAVFLHTLQRMFLNCDVGGISNREDAEYNDYTTRIKCYDDDVFFDFEHFDADTFAFYVMMRNNPGDIYEKLERVPPTQENYKSIREVLFCVNSIEYLDWIVDNFGANIIISDEELLENLYKNYDKYYIDDLLGMDDE